MKTRLCHIQLWRFGKGEVIRTPNREPLMASALPILWLTNAMSGANDQS